MELLSMKKYTSLIHARLLYDKHRLLQRKATQSLLEQKLQMWLLERKGQCQHPPHPHLKKKRWILHHQRQQLHNHLLRLHPKLQWNRYQHLDLSGANLPQKCTFHLKVERGGFQ
jgi:hypothetical protein